MSVRRLGPADVETLRSIRLEALRSDPDSFGSTLEREEGRSDDDWRAWLGRGATFVAEEEGHPVGLVVVVPDEDDPTTVGLYAMFVSQRARRQGVGRALIDAAIDWAKVNRAERVTLMVLEGNDSAMRLYESCGFTYSGESERRERDDAIELAMTRVIRTAR
jgi:GNAT superfamily N-acetyltransferase